MKRAKEKTKPDAPAWSAFERAVLLWRDPDRPPPRVSPEMAIAHDIAAAAHDILTLHDAEGAACLAVLFHARRGDDAGVLQALASSASIVADTSLGRVARGELAAVLDVAAKVVAEIDERTRAMRAEG